jgi:hypothetical protein
MADDAPDPKLQRSFTPPDAWKRAHGVEQLGAIAGELAHPVAVFYQGLRDNGVDEETAVKISEAFMRKLLGDFSA